MRLLTHTELTLAIKACRILIRLHTIILHVIISTMSLYTYSNITLLPPPPRMPLSLGPELTRARLPDFDTVEQLSQFVERIFVYDLSYVSSIREQIIFTAAFVCFLVIVAFSILVRRMYDKSFWIIRIIKRPTGNVLVPNSMICFALVEGLFGACFVAMMWYIYCTFYTQSVPARLQPFWLLVPWCPLIIGAVWAAWGLFFAAPLRIQHTDSPGGRLAYIVSHAWFTNAVGVCTPLIMCATIAFPCIKAMIEWTDAYYKRLSWQSAYAKHTLFTQEMVQEAQIVWFTALRSYYITTATFLVWTLWAFTVFVGYTWTAVRLINVIRTETSKMKDFGPRHGITIVTRAGVADEGMTVQGSAETVRKKTSDQLEFSVSSMSKGNVFSDAGASTKVDMRSSIARPASAVVASKARSFFRRIPLPNIIMQSSNEPVIVPHRQLRKDQVSQLNKALVHILIQVCAVSPACLFFTFVALFLGICLFSSLEHPRNGGTYVEVVVAVAICAVDWIVCVFGGVTLIALAQRTYEHMFSHIQVSGPTPVISIDETPQHRLGVLTLDAMDEMTEMNMALAHVDRPRESLEAVTKPSPAAQAPTTMVAGPTSPPFSQFVGYQTGGSTAQPFAIENDSRRDSILDAYSDERIGAGVTIERTTIVVCGSEGDGFGGKMA